MNSLFQKTLPFLGFIIILSYPGLQPSHANNPFDKNSFVQRAEIKTNANFNECRLSTPLENTLLVHDKNREITLADSIQYYKSGWGYSFYQGETFLRQKEIGSIIKTNPEAMSKLGEAQSMIFWGSTLSYTGGALIGVPIITAMFGMEPPWWLAGVGLGIMGVAIPIALKANNKIKESVDIYNNNITGLSASGGIKFKLGITGSGAGLLICF